MVGRYQPYPVYKDSEVKCLGRIPFDWKLCRLKFMVRIKNGQDYKSVEIDKGYPVIGSGGQFTYASEYMYDKESVLLGRKGTIDKPLYIDEPFWTVDTMYYTEINKDIDAKYLYYLSLTIQFEQHSTNTALPSMTQENLGNSIFAIPKTKSDKIKIANFLDHETAKIDTLIEKQQQLIKLLKEKRQAVISHAVTKGLNPNAPMRDSGVEWLGEVPEHWTLKNYRYAARIYRGKFGHRPRNDPAFYDGKYPFIQTGDVAQAGKTITSYKQTLNERGISVSQKFPSGTLVMAIAANIGDTAILDFEAYAPDSIVGFKPNQDIDLEFLRYSLMAALPALEQTSTQSTQANLNIDRIGTVKASFPPLLEQRKVVEKLDALHVRYAEVENKAIKAIELMQERRTALISAAVTGKIDVRNWQPPKANQSSSKGAT